MKLNIVRFFSQLYLRIKNIEIKMPRCCSDLFSLRFILSKYPDSPKYVRIWPVPHCSKKYLCLGLTFAWQRIHVLVAYVLSLRYPLSLKYIHKKLFTSCLSRLGLNYVVNPWYSIESSFPPKTSSSALQKKGKENDWTSITHYQVDLPLICV